MGGDPDSLSVTYFLYPGSLSVTYFLYPDSLPVNSLFLFFFRMFGTSADVFIADLLLMGMLFFMLCFGMSLEMHFKLNFVHLKSIS